MHSLHHQQTSHRQKHGRNEGRQMPPISSNATTGAHPPTCIREHQKKPIRQRRQTRLICTASLGPTKSIILFGGVWSSCLRSRCAPRLSTGQHGRIWRIWTWRRTPVLKRRGFSCRAVSSTRSCCAKLSSCGRDGPVHNSYPRRRDGGRTGRKSP